MSATVVNLPTVSGDIPAGLRSLADRIEKGEFPNLQFVAALTVDHNAGFVAYSWGPCSILEAIGAFSRAVSRDLVDEERGSATIG